jgi:hypothetical protein
MSARDDLRPNTSAPFFRAMDAWADATFKALLQGTALCQGNQSDEVKETEAVRTLEAARDRLVFVFAPPLDPVRAHAALGLRALARLLTDVADQVDDEEVAA